jgi:putative membrane protein
MTKLIVKAGVALASVWLTAHILKEGVTLEGTIPTVIVSILLAFINAFVRPILKFLSFPVTMITMGLFPLVINAGLILLVDNLVEKGFHVNGIFWALAFSLVLSVVSWAFDFVTAPLQK